MIQLVFVLDNAKRLAKLAKVMKRGINEKALIAMHKSISGLLHSFMLDEMFKKKSGVKYPNLPNRSSAPGQSPAAQSGALFDSIKDDISAFQSELGYTAKYGEFLEMGTSRMAPRPLVQRLVKKGDVLYKKRLLQFIRRAVRGL